MLEMQRFINVQTAAIHKADPKALVTVGIWNEKAGTDAFGYFNFFRAECLVAAGGADAFYTGPIAADIAAAVTNASRNPTPMTLGDLAGYKAKMLFWIIMGCHARATLALRITHKLLLAHAKSEVTWRLNVILAQQNSAWEARSP